MATRRKTGGRTKGTPNKVNTAVKEAIIGAFDKLGGESYLVKVAQSDPKTFCMLLGKVMPTQLTAAADGPIRVASDDNSARDKLMALIEGVRSRQAAASNSSSRSDDLENGKRAGEVVHKSTNTPDATLKIVRKAGSTETFW